MCDDGRGGAIVAFRTSTIALRAQHIGVDAPVGAEASLADMKATPTQVSLDWSSADAAIGPERVDRRTESESWIEVAILLPDGAGRVRFQDHTVTSGARYGYRLRYESNGSKRSSAETWVTVPLAPRFALHGAAPNPAVHEHLNIAFALEGELPAKLELFGIDGRRVISRDVSALAAGEHALNIAQGIRIAPGIYWVSLTQGGRHAGSRVVIVD